MTSIIQYTVAMDRQTRFQQFDQNLAALVMGDLSSADDLEFSCRDFYRHVAQSMGRLIDSVPAWSDHILEQKIDELEEEEKSIYLGWKPIFKQIDQVLMNIVADSPETRASLESPLRTALSHGHLMVELMRDTRMTLVGLLAERQKGMAPVATCRPGDDLDEVLDTLLP